jgi:UTP--glucose-1-phosphate uridylyltransferase
MIEVYKEVQGPVILVERIPKDQISGYGVIAAEPLRNGVYRIRDLVEKPSAKDAPSDLAIIGRYILTPDIFDALVTEAGAVRSGEIQLTNGLKRLLSERQVYACEVTGTRHDTGNKLGFLKAVVYFALQRPDLAEPFREYLKSLEVPTLERR